MQLLLIRHPPPAVAHGICYGATDLPLAGDPASHAAILAPLLPADVPLYSSPLQRCQQLAERLRPAPIVDERLREMDFGAWEMQPWENIDRAALDAWAIDPLGFAPPGGESAAALEKRVLDFLADLAAAKIESAALVTHAGVMKVITGHARHLSHNEWMKLAFAWSEMVTVDFEPKKTDTGQGVRFSETGVPTGIRTPVLTVKG